jgi:hypothetical protein
MRVLTERSLLLMTTSSYMPGTDNVKADLLDHLANTLPTYASLLMISDEDVASLKTDALAFRYSLLTLGEIQASSQIGAPIKIFYAMGVAGVANDRLFLPCRNPLQRRSAPALSLNCQR